MENNIEQATKWFRNLFQGCYIKRLDEYPDRIFWIYDKTLERKRKIARLNNNDYINIILSNGEIIFDQDVKNGEFWIKKDGYWSFLQLNFNLNYEQIKELTADVINEVLNCNEYKTSCFRSIFTGMINEVLNCKQYKII